MATLKDDIARLKAILISTKGNGDLAEVEGILDRFRVKNSSEKSLVVSCAIRDFSRCFRELGKDDGALRIITERLQKNALNAISRLELVIAAEGDSITPPASDVPPRQTGMMRPRRQR